MFIAVWLKSYGKILHDNVRYMAFVAPSRIMFYKNLNSFHIAGCQIKSCSEEAVMSNTGILLCVQFLR